MRKGSISLQEARPDLAKQWSKNNELRADEVSWRSNKNFLWECEIGHEWAATPSNRSAPGRTLNCPICSNRKLLQGFNDLATTHPHILDEWDYERNKVKPNEIGAGAALKVWWKCRDEGHSYPMRIVDKSPNDRQCVYCCNQKVWLGFNDLATLFPEVAEEWDFEKNEIGPHEILAFSGKYAYWKCKRNHSWRATVEHRTRRGHVCIRCSRWEKRSKGEKELGDWLESLKFKVERGSRLLGRLELDVYLSDLAIAIEYDGAYWHSINGAQERDTRKEAECSTRGITLLRVDDLEWSTNKEAIKEDLLSKIYRSIDDRAKKLHAEWKRLNSNPATRDQSWKLFDKQPTGMLIRIEQLMGRPRYLRDKLYLKR